MNLQMLLFKAFAIVDVVLRHRYWPFSQFMFIASSIPLFLFLSGYFYKGKDEHDPFNFTAKKFKRLILLYFAYNAVYALITYYLYKETGTLMGQLPTFSNFFIQPFIDGQQYSLSSPMWFVPFFFTVQIVYMLISKIIRKFSSGAYVHFIVFSVLGLSGFCLRMTTGEADRYPFLCLGLRLLVGMFFIALGYLFKTKLEKVNIYQVKFLFVALAGRILLYLNFRNPCYSFANADFDNWGVLFYSIIDIYFMLYLSKVVSGLIKPDNFMYKVGNNTFHIMANHMLLFYILDCLLIEFTGQDPSVPSSTIWTYTWMGYLFLGIIVPTYAGASLKSVRKEIDAFVSLHFPKALEFCDKIMNCKIRIFTRKKAD